MRIQSEHLLNAQFRLLPYLLVLVLDVCVGVEFDQESEAQRLLESAYFVVLLVECHEVQEVPACVFKPAEIETPQKVLAEVFVHEILL